MTEEQKVEEKTTNPPAEAPASTPYDSDQKASDFAAKKEADVQKSLEKISEERKEMNELRRFGYFSIPYPATVGDQAYSQNQEYPNHKVVDRKVIIENRGIYTNNPKSGNGPDAYFSPVEPVSDEKINEYKEQTKKDRENYLAKMKEKREKKELFKFKPAGPQDMIGFYREGEQQTHDGPLNIEPDKKRFILEGGKVKTENRNIFTNPTKVGKSFKPDDYFQFYVADDAVQERLKEMEKKDREKKLNQVKERKLNQVTKPPFHPAALKKCEPFSSVIETYGLYNEAENQQLLQEYRDYKKKGNPKYQKVLPKGSVVHDKPFQPARLIYQGRDGLFNDDLYKIPEPTEKDKKKVLTVKERKEIEEANKAKRRVPFTYNKLMKSSTFAPPISSFMTNLRREFPTIKFH